MTNKEYNSLLKAKSPNSPLCKNMFFAFLIGGAICALGEGLRLIYINMGAETKVASTLVSVSLIFISAVLTGFGIYNKIAKIGGAGTLVPITGFANAVVAPAIEFKPEGYILGVGAKMFVIAGPVIVYGTVASVIYGIIYWIIEKI